jgi:hypothetical protein
MLCVNEVLVYSNAICSYLLECCSYWVDGSELLL